MMYRELFEYPDNPASEEEIDHIKRWCGSFLPQDYLRFLRECNGAETPKGSASPDDSVVLWGAMESCELTEAYCYMDYIPRTLAIGSDGGGESIIFDRSQGETPDNWPIYRVPMGDLCLESMVLLAASFKEWREAGFPLKFENA
ncbi:SMI1/KNR4 family protein [Pelagibaculum spongiae]|uniref:SMI1/KNR4 family protein n=1 Tax=Pelagibaculum spongiae TaxID=2080658 RepID=A0A2V1GUS5_9GAMM|nr:SMI1/KNR4 family protein [Pelagibaculum spongiae]PVZ66648.1 SMI1/KNR4 family protein [Pelagibaculum spongiae]PVZ68857.1 SMI1/KNR4 family protein [Pelagibaculum spongiae]